MDNKQLVPSQNAAVSPITQEDLKPHTHHLVKYPPANTTVQRDFKSPNPGQETLTSKLKSGQQSHNDEI
jgi:hypothetical protein